MKLKDITYELSQFERGLLFYNCENIILVGGSQDGTIIRRRFRSNTMKDPNNPDEVYTRTGEVLCNEENDNAYYLVFRNKG